MCRSLLEIAKKHGAEDMVYQHVHYMEQGNFTLAVIEDASGKMMSFGIAKRNPMDKANGITARRIATTRAFKRYGKGGAN